MREKIIGAAAIVLVTGAPAVAQQCPQPQQDDAPAPSEVRTLNGGLIYHDGIRQWFELKLDQPQCGQTSIQLVLIGADDWTPLEVLRGCNVASTGAIDFSPTNYYSLDLYQNVDRIEPVGTCSRQPPFPVDQRAKPDKSIRKYRVEMRVDYRPGDHPVIFHVSRAGKELQPWQAYASYLLTGGFVLYGYCADGFVVDKVFGTPEAHPSHFDEPRTANDAAMFDPETAAASGKKDLRLGYTCVRKKDNE